MWPWVRHFSVGIAGTGGSRHAKSRRRRVEAVCKLQVGAEADGCQAPASDVCGRHEAQAGQRFQERTDGMLRDVAGAVRVGDIEPLGPVGTEPPRPEASTMNPIDDAAGRSVHDGKWRMSRPLLWARDLTGAAGMGIDVATHGLQCAASVTSVGGPPDGALAVSGPERERCAGPPRTPG